MLDKKEDRSQGFAYDYGSGTQELDHDDTSELLKEADILQYVDDLTDKDRLTLNDMARKYGVRNYARLLRMAKMDRDDQLRELQANQKSKDGKPSGRKKKEDRHRKRRRRPSFDRVDPSSRREHSGRAYDSSESESSEDEQEQTASDVVIEFQSPPVVEEKEETQAKSSSSSSSSSSSALNIQGLLKLRRSRQKRS
ncbi:hypothetical protein BCR43DRAFT_355879 [Syncephalastrum racemosum]|uniref:Suppressor of white apricot N-terminal domain-containing protein n=1 Tax=Syncephalastrum racemosum TaxID=13706 RepID=A0A1X2H7W2_SYNRA|nr:hypothetical protein BCR43DRAFT_355879 [Syncephalastrum racemosum]